MTKRELIIEIHRGMQEKQPDIAVTTVERMLDAFCAVAAAELLGGGEVPLPGIGKIKVKKFAARQGRNPKTGEPLTIPAYRKPILTVSKELKDALR